MITHIHFAGYKEGYKGINMYINYCLDRKQLSFQIHTPPYPTPNKQANGWFTFDVEESKKLMELLKDIPFHMWKSDESDENILRYYWKIEYVVDDKEEHEIVFVNKEPLCFERFLAWINMLYPIKEKETFIWKDGYYNEY